jgi:hypothetical protein
LSLSARLKKLQVANSDESAQGAIYLKEGPDVRPEEEDLLKAQSPGYIIKDKDYSRRAWVEWKRVPQLGGLDLWLELHKRVQTLQVVLRAAKSPEYYIPPCEGLLRAIGGRNSFDIGMAYSLPGDIDASECPQTMIQLIDNEDMPSLNDRYAITYSISSALLLFHASKWLHRAFRSDNALFFKDWSGNVLYQRPYITAFEYSRPQLHPSLDVRQTRDPSLCST